MKTEDREQFDRAMRNLCIGFDTPPTQARFDAYWTGLQKMQIAELQRAIEHALGEEGPEKLPTTGQLWRIRAFLKRPHASSQSGDASAIDTSFATVQKQLFEYACIRSHDLAGPIGMTLREYSRPWVYVYREWIDHERAVNKDGKCAEVIGLVIELDGGKRLGWSVAMMLADTEGYEQTKKHFQPGPRPTHEQIANWHEAQAALTEKLKGAGAP